MSTSPNKQNGAATLPTPQALASARDTRNSKKKIPALLIIITLYFIFLYHSLHSIKAIDTVMEYFQNVPAYLAVSLVVFLHIKFLQFSKKNSRNPKGSARGRPSSSKQAAKDKPVRAKKEEVVEPDTPTPEMRPSYYEPFPFKHFQATGESFAKHNFDEPVTGPTVPRPTYPRRESFHFEAAYLPKQGKKTSTVEAPCRPEGTELAIKESVVPVVPVVVDKPAYKASEQLPLPTTPPTYTPVAPVVVDKPAHKAVEQLPLPALAPTYTPKVVGQLPLPALAPTYTPVAPVVVEKPAYKALGQLPLPALAPMYTPKAVEQRPLPALAPTYTPVAPAVPTSLSTEVIQGPVASAPGPVIIQVGLPVVRPSAMDMQIGLLDHLAGQEYQLQQGMEALFAAFTMNGAYDGPAELILALMEEAKANLLPLFPTGLTGLNPDRLIWKNALITFWEAVRPYGYDFQHHTDENLRVFLVVYHEFVCWMGLGDYLLPFVVTAPPAPEPTPYLPQLPLQTPIQHPTTAVSFQAPSWEAQEVSRPAPAFSLPTQGHSIQQPQAAHAPSALLNFDDNDWLSQPDDILKELTWESFAWPSPEQGRYTIWSFSTMGLMDLPSWGDPSVLTPNIVKGAFEQVAPMFKRACVVLRLQLRDCARPSKEKLGATPLFEEILALLQAAKQMTDDCEKVISWNLLNEWHLACLFFRDALVKDVPVWKELSNYHKTDKRRAVKNIWKDMKIEWIGDNDD
ncbi:2-dehydropantoate 2-reductase [Pyrenophora seminiperda CCB06]|uniref:2-dehydropantoate 2-reductase n=1 Tax=Pyrenophora seminiperda CCB06 TaxID=1302712 RepID=A0A3M7M550_9PLEO|nr:2-dehydropantoate 2-reductase [Pyrenophora seminiperda CCB06]